MTSKKRVCTGNEIFKRRRRSCAVWVYHPFLQDLNLKATSWRRRRRKFPFSQQILPYLREERTWIVRERIFAAWDGGNVAVLEERNGFDPPKTDNSTIIHAIRNTLSFFLLINGNTMVMPVPLTANTRIDERSNYRYRVIIRLSNTLSRNLHARFARGRMID